MNIEEISGGAWQFEAAFTEWDRRYREEPERFMSEAVHLLKETPETYGQAAAPYFMAILREVAERRGDKAQDSSGRMYERSPIHSDEGTLWLARSGSGRENVFVPKELKMIILAEFARGLSEWYALAV